MKSIPIWLLVSTSVFNLIRANEIKGTNAESPSVNISVPSGKALFEKNCASCHGLDGAKGKFGAKNLQKSILTDQQYLSIIQKGKWIMPSWEKKLSSSEILNIISYIKSLKK